MPNTLRIPEDDPLGAFCRENHVALPGAAEGPLADLTFAVKDVFDIAGTRTGFGHPGWLQGQEPAGETAVAVRQLLDAGADLLGRTLTDELAYSLTGENAHYGTPVNPADPSRLPGGSSSGSASAVAGGMVDFALGSDCGGSVRIPASYCGILGIRPTHGRVSLDGAVRFAPSFDAAGWFARDASCLRRVGEVLLGDDDREPGEITSLIVARDAFALAGADVVAELQPAIPLVGDQVAEVRTAEVSLDGLDAWRELFSILQGAEVWESLGGWIERRRPALGRGVRDRLDWAAAITTEQFAHAAEGRRAVLARLDAILPAGTALCLPTSPRPAPPKGTDVEGEVRRTSLALLCIAGLGGLPQVTLPLAALGGLPVGLSLVGARGSDLALLALAERVMEQAADRLGDIAQPRQ